MSTPERLPGVTALWKTCALLFGMFLYAGSVLVHAGESGTEEAADAPKPFPRTLTLGDALSMLGDDDPALLLSRARMAANEADRLRLDDRYGFSSSLDLDLRTADKVAIPGHDFINDSFVILSVDKPLTRFGADKGLYQALDSSADAIAARSELTRAELRHQVIEAFYGVILADYAYNAQDEVMTLAFLEFDDARELMELYNEVSEVEVRRLEARYLDAFAERTRFGHQRRASRLRLALALNRSDAYPDRMVEPDLSPYDRETPDYEEVLARVLEQSAEYRATKLETVAARQRLEAVSLGDRPVLGAQFEAGEYRRRAPLSRDQFRASLYLEIPIGGEHLRRGEIASASARLLETEARLSALEHELRLQVLRLVQQLAHLDTELRAAEAELLHSELELDRVRLLYEMEVRARIGRANADVAAAVYRQANARYQRALAWNRLDILMNNEPVQFQ
jgi:outer membrane protein TolC